MEFPLPLWERGQAGNIAIAQARVRGPVTHEFGSSPSSTENAEAERIRTAFLEKEGFRVLRFWNLELKNNFDGVMERIRLAVFPLTRA